MCCSCQCSVVITYQRQCVARILNSNFRGRMCVAAACAAAAAIQGSFPARYACPLQAAKLRIRGSMASSRWQAMQRHIFSCRYYNYLIIYHEVTLCGHCGEALSPR